MRVLAVVPGPPGSGVTRHGVGLAALLTGSGVEVTVVRSLRPATGVHDLTHVQFTDALFGRDIAAAAACFEGWAATVPRPLVVTLHDVPGRDVDAARDARRLAGYRRVAAAADAVVVSAPHEATGLGRDAAVVPLPLERVPAPGAPPGWADGPSVGVLGFVYPGKGHDLVVDAVASLPGPRPRVVAIGATSPGHGALRRALGQRAARAGVELVVTGPLSAADLHAAAVAVTVPVAAYRTLGSSASLLTWLACGRRPLVTPGPQARDVEDRWPGVTLPAGDLPAAVADALGDPGSTRLPAAPPAPDTAGAHVAVYRDACRTRGESGGSG